MAASVSCAGGDSGDTGEERDAGVTGERSTAPGATARELSGLDLLAQTTLSDCIRPELAATEDRVFVVNHSLNGQTYNVRVLSRDLGQEVGGRVLVESSEEYGSPTDIRIAQDGDAVYAFYETVDGKADAAYLRGSKYKADDGFKETASTGLISSGHSLEAQQAGDEMFDDPVPLVGPDSVFAITRYKDTMAEEGKSIYRVYEFHKDDLSLVRAFDLDLSSVVKGGARQAAAVYRDGSYYLALPTTVGEPRQDFAAITPSDIVVVRLDADWNIRESKVVSADPGDTEFYVSGLQFRDGLFYMCYNKRDGGRFSNMLKVYDEDFNLVYSQELSGSDSGPGAGGRVSILATGDQLIAGLGPNKDDRDKSAGIRIYQPAYKEK
jgi:hypothetical protein